MGAIVVKHKNDLSTFKDYKYTILGFVWMGLFKIC